MKGDPSAIIFEGRGVVRGGAGWAGPAADTRYFSRFPHSYPYVTYTNIPNPPRNPHFPAPPSHLTAFQIIP